MSIKNKHILFVKNFKDDQDSEKISHAWSQTKVEFELLQSSKAVVVYGRNDVVYIAKTALTQAGYIIE